MKNKECFFELLKPSDEREILTKKFDKSEVKHEK